MTFSFLKGSFEEVCHIDSLIQSMGNAFLDLGSGASLILVHRELMQVLCTELQPVKLVCAR